MNYCTKCQSIYSQPGTCNCYAAQPVVVVPGNPLSPTVIPTYPYPSSPTVVPYTPYPWGGTITWYGSHVQGTIT